MLAAISGLAAMVIVGGSTRQPLLKLIFAVWIVLPFVALWQADKRAATRPIIASTTLYPLMLVVAAGSLIIYGNAVVNPRASQPAFTFLVVPFFSWLLLAVVALIARRR